MADESKQHVSWVLPTATVDRVKSHMAENDFANQSEAAADLLSGGNDRLLGRDASSGQTIMSDGTAGPTVLSNEPGITSMGDERHSVPENVDPHESYPTRPMVPQGETVRTVGTDGAPIAAGATGEIGDSEETDETLPDVGESANK